MAPLPPEGEFHARLAVPLRVVMATFAIGLGVASVINFAFGVPLTGLATGVGCAMSLLAWRIEIAGRRQAAANLLFYAIVIVLAMIVTGGHGTRDYSLIAIPAVVFAASVFLTPAAYWGLAALFVAFTLVLGLGEVSGWLYARHAPVTGTREVVNLLIIVVASTVGGRAFMHAIRSSFARERALSGALESSEERIRSLLRSSQNAIVVSRLADGKYFEVNEAYLALFGYRRDEVIGRTAVELGVWEDARDRERYVRVLSGSGTVRDYEARMRRRTGEPLEVLLSAERMRVGGEDCQLVSVADVTARREAERRAEFLATRDALTGLPNRAVALDRLGQGLARAAASGRAIAVVHLDIDRFKAVNESLGYAAGDEVLREVGERLAARMGAGDTVARIGGEEFIAIAESLAGAGDAEAVALRLRSAFDEPFAVAGRALHLAASAGAAVGPGEGIDAERLLRRAETALNVAKGEGRGNMRLFDESMKSRGRDRLAVEGFLREALERGELRLAYQPKFDAATRKVTGFEALARWTHAELGEVAPGTFIPVAEESGLIHALGDWVLREACEQIARWRSQGLASVPVAINLSAPQLSADLPRLVAERARERGVDPGLVELEVTESMLIKNPEATRRVLEQVAARGSRIVLDDFGVGYSSLNYVKHLEIHAIKIDRSFVRDLIGSRHDAAIVRAIVGLAHGLGIRVVAEGIEFEAQLEALRELGCDEVQGFFLGAPTAAGEVAAKYLGAAEAGRLAG